MAVVRRDVVRAGLSGSRREANNFRTLHRLLFKHKVYIAVLSSRDDELVRHDLGFAGGQYSGTIFWDLEKQHASSHEYVQIELSDSAPPWSLSCVGGKRAKAKPKPTKKTQSVQFKQHSEVVDIIKCL